MKFPALVVVLGLFVEMPCCGLEACFCVDVACVVGGRSGMAGVDHDRIRCA